MQCIRMKKGKYQLFGKEFKKIVFRPIFNYFLRELDIILSISMAK